MTAEIALGTAQFGMNYGIANQTSRPSFSEAAEILETAKFYGVNVLDTAIAYGQSETILGKLGVSGWKVISKLPSVPATVRDFKGWMLEELGKSLQRLRIDKLYGLLLHDPAQLHGDNAEVIAHGLESLREEGLVERVGVSIQTPGSDLPAVLRYMQPDLMQAPFNLLQDDLVRDRWAERLQTMGCEVHARSAFLQGLLLMPEGERPAFFAQWESYWKEWENWLGASGLTPVQACLRFVRSQSDIDCCVVGVESADQLRELFEIPAEPLETRPGWPQPTDPRLINPSRWKNQ